MNNADLILEAKKARKMSYAPYSHFKVGAALLTKEGKLYHGCNIENSSYSPTNCAERTAFFKAVSEGEREFEKIAIVGGIEGTEADELCAPCGVCRQVMMEFCDPESFQIILANGKDKHVQVSLKEMVPYGSSPKDAILKNQEK
jgi:cytidine deaminase